MLQIKNNNSNLLKAHKLKRVKDVDDFIKIAISSENTVVIDKPFKDSQKGFKLVDKIMDKVKNLSNKLRYACINGSI